MTHGNIYIPIIMENGETKYLYCEAWSDGYFTGVGYSLLTSSNHMDDIIKLNTIFAGSPFYYDPQTHKFEAKEGEYLIEGFEDSSEDESLIEKATECFEYFEEGDLEKVYASDFAKISLEEKIDKELGINAKISSFEEVMKDNIMISNIPEIINEVQRIAKEDDRDVNSCVWSSTQYIYYDNQWYVGIYSEKSEKVYIPAIIAALNFVSYKPDTQPGTFTNPYVYIEQGASEKDFQTLKALYQYNLENNIDMTQTGWNYIKEYVEKMQLEEKIPAISSNKNNAIKL